MTISNQMTVIGLSNGMIGGVILVLPLLALKTGWLLITPITLISGFFSYFSCLLCLRHLRNYKSLDIAIYHHFGKKKAYKIFYDVIIVISMSVLLILYFSLICEQWQGIATVSKAIPIVNALILFPIVYLMKKFDFGTTLLAYGILSVIGYVTFLIWMFFDTKPGQNKVPAVYPDFVDLAAALAQGFAIQTFFIPILKKNPNKKLYKLLLGATYIVGTIVYGFISYAGAYSIVNRQAHNPRTIEDFFGNGKTWQVVLVQIIYLVHLYSAFPQFLLVAKERFFSIFKWPEPTNVSMKEILYVAATIFVCLLIQLTGISVQIIIQINGSIISFFFIYVIPIGLHMKCVYFTKPDQRHQMLNQEKQNQNFQENIHKNINSGKQSLRAHSTDQNQKEKQIVQMQQVNYIDQKQQSISQSEKNSSSKQSKVQNIIQQKLPPCQCDIIQQKQPPCQCDIKYSSRFQQYGQLCILATMVLVGLCIMAYTLYLLAVNDESSDQT